MICSFWCSAAINPRTTHDKRSQHHPQITMFLLLPHLDWEVDSAVAGSIIITRRRNLLLGLKGGRWGGLLGWLGN